VRDIFKLQKENVMAIGDNYNDHELLEESAYLYRLTKVESMAPFMFRSKASFFLPMCDAENLVD